MTLSRRLPPMGPQGLSAGEARARLDRYGRNELTAQPPIPAWRKFLAQFQDGLVILLLVATAVSALLWLYERDTPLPYDALAISGAAEVVPVRLSADRRRSGRANPHSSVAQWQSIRLLTGGLQVRVLPEEPAIAHAA